MRQNIATPTSVRKQPETFCWTLIMRRSLSAWLLDKAVNYTVSIFRGGNIHGHPSLSSLVRATV